MRKKLLIPSALLLVLAGVGCKPTVENYKNSYEVAIAKKQADEAKAKADPSEEGMIAFSNTQVQVQGGDSVRVLYETLRMDGDVAPPQSVNVAVGKFKMRTNARGGADMFKQEGYPSFAARNSQGKWYVILGSYESLEKAKEATKRFRKSYPDYPYVGLEVDPNAKDKAVYIISTR